MAGMCSGTAVSDTTVITAAHCVFDHSQPSPVSEDGVLTGKKFCVTNSIYRDICSEKIIIRPSFVKRGANNDFEGSDLAFVIFPESTFKSYFEIETTMVSQGDDIVMLGYSELNLTEMNRGSKRFGYNRIKNLEGGQGGDDIVIQSNANFLSAGTAQGDSGGPMFKGCRVAGVCSRGSGQGAGKITIHTNVSSPINQKFLKEFGEKHGAYFCGLSGQDSSRCDKRLRFDLVEELWRKGEEFPCDVKEKDKDDDVSPDDADKPGKIDPRGIFAYVNGDAREPKLVLNIDNQKSGLTLKKCSGKTMKEARDCRESKKIEFLNFEGFFETPLTNSLVEDSDEFFVMVVGKSKLNDEFKKTFVIKKK
jgi:hypothetical protein